MRPSSSRISACKYLLRNQITKIFERRIRGALHDFAKKEGDLDLAHSKPVGYSSRDFSYHKSTAPDGLNKKTAYSSWRTDHLKMLGPQLAELGKEDTGAATGV